MANEKSIYKALTRTPFRGVVRAIREKLVTMCPYSKSDLYATLDKIILRSCILSVLVAIASIFISVFGNGLTLYSIAVAIFTCWATYHLSVSFHLKGIQRKINKDMNTYFTNVIYGYQNSHSVQMALYSAALGLSKEMNAINEMIMDLLNSENPEQTIKNFVIDSERSPYIRLFVSQCYDVSDKGDIVTDGVSLFCANIEHLRSDFLNMMLREEKREYTFKGLSVMTVAAGPLLPILHKMCMDFSPESYVFYANYGTIIEIVTLASAVLISRMFQKNNGTYLKIKKKAGLTSKLTQITEGKMYVKESSKVKDMLRITGENISAPAFYAKMILFGLVAIAATILILIKSNITYRREIINSTNISNISCAEKQEEAVRKAVIEISKKYSKEDLTLIPDKQLEQEIKRYGRFTSKYLRAAITTEIRVRVGKAQGKELLAWWQFMLSLVAGAAAFLPLIELELNYSMTKSKSTEEAQIFQTLVLLEKEFQNTTVFSLLQCMGSYTTLYKKEFSMALAEFPFDPELSFGILQRIDNSDIKEIIAQLQASDKVGIKTACANIETNIIMSSRTREQELDISDNKRKNTFSLLSAVPLAIGFVGYFLLPFLATSLADANGIFELMGSM